MEYLLYSNNEKGTNIPCKHKCLVCGKEFSQKNSLYSHLKLHTKSDLYQCDYCLKSYTRKSTLEQHIRKHTKINIFQCKLCDKFYTVKAKLQIHLRCHANYKPFNCSVCDRSYRYKHSLVSHLSSHKGEEHTCQFCGKVYGKKGNLDRHLLLHEGSKLFECKVCSKKFYQKIHLMNHSTVHNEEKRFLCQYCGKHFNRKDSLVKHGKLHNILKNENKNIIGNEISQGSNHVNAANTQHNNKEKDRNEKCNIEMYSQNVVMSHEHRINVSHKGNDTDDNIILVNKSLDDYDQSGDYRINSDESKSTYNRVLKNYNAIMPLQTDHIDEVSKVSFGPTIMEDPLNMLSKIDRESEKDSKHKCTICSKNYKHEKSLKLHMRLHTLEKTIVCEICFKVFAVLSKYEAHKLSHMGVKQFVCNLCGKRFTAKHSLEGHYRSHNGEKPVQCSECGVRFTKQSSLSRHSLLHSCAGRGERGVRAARALGGGVRAARAHGALCAACGRRFGRQDVLNVHMKTCLRPG